MLSGSFLFFSSIGQVQGLPGGRAPSNFDRHRQAKMRKSCKHIHSFYANSMLNICVFLVLIFPGQKACAGANIYAFCISGLALWVDLDLVSSFQSLVRTCWLTSTKL